MAMRSEDLTGAERLVRDAFPHGERVDLRVGDPALDDPALGAGWGASRTIRAEVIRGILLGGGLTAEPGAVAAVRVVGARISGGLDLVHAELPCPVYLERCWFEESLDLRWAVARYFDLSWSCLPGLMADDLRVDGQLVLSGCQINGTSRPPAASQPACDPWRTVPSGPIGIGNEDHRHCWHVHG